jgi:hypothetical protein
MCHQVGLEKKIKYLDEEIKSQKEEVEMCVGRATEAARIQFDQGMEAMKNALGEQHAADLQAKDETIRSLKEKLALAAAGLDPRTPISGAGSEKSSPANSQPDAAAVVGPPAQDLGLLFAFRIVLPFAFRMSHTVSHTDGSPHKPP